MITRIYADNFKCLSNFEFLPKQLNLLLGENGSGKTSLFAVLLRLRALLVEGQSAAALFPVYDKTLWNDRDVQSFELEVEGAGGTFVYRLEIQHPVQPAPQKSQVRAERLDFDEKPLFRYSDGQVHLFNDDHSAGPVFPFKPDLSFFPNLESQNSRLQWFKDFVARINAFQLNPFAIDPFTKQQDQRFLSTNGENFVSWLRLLSEEWPKAKTECEERLATIIPAFENFRFQPTGDRKALMATFSPEDGRREYQLLFSQLSEGQRILAILYSVLYGLVGKASVLCFDEPENFVSLPEIQPWLQDLRDLVEERSGQALVISHHPEVIDYLADDSAFRFERPNGDLVRVSEWIPDPAKLMKPSEILVRGG